MTLLAEGHHYTVFAPTDDAFDAMETSVLESLMLDDRKLKKVTKYNIERYCHEMHIDIYTVYIANFPVGN